MAFVWKFSSATLPGYVQCSCVHTCHNNSFNVKLSGPFEKIYSTSDRPEGQELGGGAVGSQEGIQVVKF